MHMCLKFLERYQNLGFLILRVGIGLMFMHHGYGKLFGGSAMWEKIGGAMATWGIPSSLFTVFGFLASCSEFFGGLCLILGLGFRLACLFLFSTMVVAATMHLAQGDGLNKASHAIEAAILFLSLIFIGPGAYTLDEKLKKAK